MTHFPPPGYSPDNLIPGGFKFIKKSIPLSGFNVVMLMNFILLNLMILPLPPSVGGQTLPREENTILFLLRQPLFQSIFFIVEPSETFSLLIIPGPL
jgi:hypothetical protein